MTNDLAKQSGRRPRSIVRVTWWKSFNQQVTDILYGWEEWEVENNAFRSADIFMVRFSLSKMPAQYNLAWWASQTSITLEILAGFPRDPESAVLDEYDSLIIGQVDRMDYNPATRTIEVSGRDLTALLIDTKSAETFLNRRASDIAITLATRHGLTPQVTQTPKMVGGYYEAAVALTNVEKTEWDVLCKLADQEQFVTYVTGKTLYFGPKVASNPYTLHWQDAQSGQPAQFPGMGLRFSRNMHISRGIVVKVSNFNVRNKKGFQAVYPKGANPDAPAAAGVPAPEVHKFKAPANYMPDQLTKLAQAYYAQLTAHEMNVSVEIPADHMAMAGMQLQIAGTDSTFDQAYWIDSVTRRMEVDIGYAMSIRAKNQSPELAQVA